MANSRNTDPLGWNVKIVNEDGTPTPEFMRQWSSQKTLNVGLAEVIGLLDVELIAGLGITGGGVLGDLVDITFTLDTEFVQDLVGAMLADSSTIDFTYTDGAGTFTAALKDTAVTPGSYTSVDLTVDQQGRITAIADGSGGSGDADILQFITVPANPGFDPLFSGPAGAVTLSNSNKRATPASGGPYNGMFGTPARYAGKYYFEIVVATSAFSAIGAAGGGGHHKSAQGNILGLTAPGQLGLAPAGTLQSRDSANATVSVASVAAWTSGDRVSVAIDIDAMLIWFRTNAGNWNNNALNNPATGVGGIDASWLLSGASNTLIWPAVNAGNTGTVDMFLLAADFTQSVPSGYTAWGAP